MDWTVNIFFVLLYFPFFFYYFQDFLYNFAFSHWNTLCLGVCHLCVCVCVTVSVCMFVFTLMWFFDLFYLGWCVLIFVWKFLIIISSDIFASFSFSSDIPITFILDRLTFSVFFSAMFCLFFPTFSTVLSLCQPLGICRGLSQGIVCISSNNNPFFFSLPPATISAFSLWTTGFSAPSWVDRWWLVFLRECSNGCGCEPFLRWFSLPSLKPALPPKVSFVSNFILPLFLRECLVFLERRGNFKWM